MPRANLLRAALACLVLAGMVALLWCASGCGRREAGTFVPLPRAVAQTEADVMGDAMRWAAAAPATRYVSRVAPTGSMEPYVNERSVVLCVRYTGQPLHNGAVVIYRHSERLPRVIHSIAQQSATHVYMSGFANQATDGWQPKSAIEGVMVGQLYLP